MVSVHRRWTGPLSERARSPDLEAELHVRLAECRLEHPTKTKIVYCKDGTRKGAYPNAKFDFLGYCFRPRRVKRARDNKLFCGFNPAVSPSALQAVRTAIRELDLRRQTQLPMTEIARQINPLLQGWMGYYGQYTRSALYPLIRYVNLTLLTWVMRKFKRFRDHKVRAGRFLERLARENAGFRFMVTLRTEKRRRLRRPSFGRNLPVARLVPGTAIEPGDTSPAHATPSSSFVRSLISPRPFSDALGQRPLARRAPHLSLGH
jgi:Group II intron, maturase-specific domain